MTLLHTRYISGTQITAGAVGAGSIVGLSGLNHITGRVNFANYDYMQNGSLAFTYTAGRITQVVYSGADQTYQTDIVYDAGLVGSAVTSGTTIGSQIVVELFGTGGQYVSGLTKLE